MSSVPVQKPQYATHEEAKQAFKDLLKEKVGREGRGGRREGKGRGGRREGRGWWE